MVLMCLARPESFGASRPQPHRRTEPHFVVTDGEPNRHIIYVSDSLTTHPVRLFCFNAGVVQVLVTSLGEIGMTDRVKGTSDGDVDLAIIVPYILRTSQPLSFLLCAGVQHRHWKSGMQLLYLRSR